MLAITAGTLHSALGDADFTVPMMAGYKNVDKEISDVYFGSVDGKMVDGSGWTPPGDYDPRTRSWYKVAMAKGALTFTEPYLDSVTQQMAVSVAMPVKNASGQIRGVMAEDILLSTLVDNVQKVNFRGAGYAYLLDANGLVLAHPDKAILSKNVFAEENLKAMHAPLKEILSKDKGFTRYTWKGESLLVIYEKLPSTGWTMAITVPEATVYQSLVKLQWLLAVIAVVAVLIVVGVTFTVVKRMTAPIEQLAVQVDKVAAGDLTIQSEVNGQDEIARLASGFNTMVLNLKALITHVNNNAEMLAASSEELTASAHESAETSNQVAASVTEIAARADGQLAAVRSAAAVVKTMTDNFQQVSREAQGASEKSTQATETAQKNGKVVEQAVEQINLIEKTVNESAKVVASLGERSKEIGQIVDTISGIAGQTNLLALNAAIEAARAGEQGRGFAVVAEEVRKLAEQSQEAAKQIADLITDIQSDTGKAVSAMETGTQEVKRGTEAIHIAGSAFKEIATLVMQVSNEITSISAAIRQVEQGNLQVVDSVQSIDESSKVVAGEAQSVSAATEEQSAAMQEISAASQSLAKRAEELQSAVQKFRV